ncbi:MAG: zinc-ribbon domain-containing protein [Bacilli bacterium]|nr:zinc-ribbon domain-containing protein [Bacilli bacterium]
MRCPKCNSVISDDINFCNYCGENLHKQDNIPNNQVNTQVNEEYLKAYIGKNYETIKDKQFNVFAFLFNKYYCLYRKQYKFFWILVLVSFLSLFLGALSFLATIGIQIYLGMKFNELYINEAEKDIQSIERINNGKREEEIKELCRKKGGTTFLYTGILIGVQLFAIIVLIILTLLFITTVGSTYDISDFNLNNTIQQEYNDGTI